MLFSHTCIFLYISELFLAVLFVNSLNLYFFTYCERASSNLYGRTREIRVSHNAKLKFSYGNQQVQRPQTEYRGQRYTILMLP